RGPWRLAGRCLELDLDEDEFEGVGVDHVMLDAERPVVGPARCELGEVGLLAVLELQAPGRHRHHDIVVAMAMPAGRGTRGEAPFGHLDPLIVDLDRRYRGLAPGGCRHASSSGFLLLRFGAGFLGAAFFGAAPSLAGAVSNAAFALPLPFCPLPFGPPPPLSAPRS